MTNLALLNFARKAYLILILILATSFLRPLLFALSPIIIIGFIFLFELKFSTNTIILFIFVFGITILSSLYVGEINFGNNLLSLSLILPLGLTFLSRGGSNSDKFFNFFILALTIINLANNCLGVVQLIRTPWDDDAFIGFYGKHGLAIHTLSLINFCLGGYYFFKFYLDTKSWLNLILFIFFTLSAILSFYGLGLIVFLLTLVVFKFSLRTLIKSAIISIFVIVFFSSLLYFIRPQTFMYNYENIRRVDLFFSPHLTKKEVSQIPRKLLLYRNYVECFSKDPFLFLLGTGPGTFNSRSYFLLNGDYSRTKYLEMIFGVHEPKYAREYVHPLWNAKNTVMFSDGTRNEPFSSVVAVLAEYGFLLFLLISFTVYSKYKSVLIILKQKAAQTKVDLVKYNFLKFISIFIFINLFTDNFLEYPEIMLIYLLIFKLLEISIKDFTSKTSTV
jgi:hypothetical protein